MQPTTATIPASAPAAAPPPAGNGYIVNPLYDSFFFILSPLIALALGFAISGNLSRRDVFLFGHQGSITNVFIGSFIFAHLVLVFFRSHGNRNIFKLYPIRFTVVPVLLFIAMLSSHWVLVSVGVLSVWWDVYHSSLQTFGLGRIYDARRKNPPLAGRRLDYHLNIIFYLGPILAGATLMDHMDDFSRYAVFGDVFLTHIPAYAESSKQWLTFGVIAIAVPFVIYYFYAYGRLARQGYNVSFQKVTLYASTAICSVFAWGFNTFGEAFFIMNFFHALQYFAIVWWSEQKNMLNLFRLGNVPWGKPIALILFVGIGAAYGIWAEISDAENRIALSTILVVSIMHFWYDGFIWSVRKKQI